MFFFNHGSSTAQQSNLDPRSLGSAHRDMVEYLSKPVRERQQTDVPDVWRQELHPDVMSQLKALSHGKCSFCERRAPELLVYRFRPPAYVRPAKTELDKWQYLWLTFSWQNLYPICEDCWPREKTFFPVEGRRLTVETLSDEVINHPTPEQGGFEKALLLHPGEESMPNRAFDFSFDGVLIGRNRRSKLTIDHFDLNRPPLVAERARSFQKVLNELMSGGLPMARPGDFASAEYGGSLYLGLRRIAAELAPKYGRSASLMFDRLPAVFGVWSRKDGFRGNLEASVERIVRADQQREREGGEEDRNFERWGDKVAAGRLRHISIRNFKSLEHLDLRLPDAEMKTGAPCLLVLGENAAGKSSLLQAIAATFRSPAELLTLGIDHQGSAYDPTLMGVESPSTDRVIDVELKFEVGERRLIIERDNVDITRQTAPPLFAYGPRRYFDGTVRRPGLRNVDTLFLPDRKISNPEPWLASLARRPPQVLSEVVSALRHVLQVDGEFSHIEVPRGTRGSDGICYINIKKTAADGSSFQIRQRLSVASSGYRSILALVCALYAGLMETAANEGISEADIALEARNRVAIVLIDEIEAHLHPRWKLGVIEGLRRAFPNIMFIMTSHDPLCVRGMKQGEVVVLNRYQTGVSKRPEAVEAVRLEQDFTRLTIEQLLTSELFQMFSTDDAEIDRAFAEVSVLLSKEKNDLNDQEATIVKSFEDQMSTALPYGLSEVSRLVREAVAEYVHLRRTAEFSEITRARQRAKEEVKRFLQGLVG